MVSIVVPVFNRADFLAQTIRSVQLQTVDEWELLLVDDGSTDGSFKIAQQFSEKDPRIKAVKREKLPKGAPTCRNIGISLAEGDYLMFLDSDDLLSLNCLQRRVDLLEGTQLDFVVTQCGTIKNNKSEVYHYWSSLKRNNDLEGFLNFDGWCISSSFFKTAFIKNFSFDTAAMSIQDWEFHLKVLLADPQYKKYPESPVDVYIRTGHDGRVTKIDLGIDKLKSKFNTFLTIENKLIAGNHSQLTQLLEKQYFNHLKTAVKSYTLNEYNELFELWKSSQNHKSPSSNVIRRYLAIQLNLRRLGGGFASGIVYRIFKKLARRDLFTFLVRETRLLNPFKVEDEISRLLSDKAYIKEA